MGAIRDDMTAWLGMEDIAPMGLLTTAVLLSQSYPVPTGLLFITVASMIE